MDCQPQRLRLSRRPGFRLQAHSVAINGLDNARRLCKSNVMNYETKQTSAGIPGSHRGDRRAGGPRNTKADAALSACGTDTLGKIKKRFLAKIEISPLTQCWVWKGRRNLQGYGGFQVSNYHARAHRVAFVLWGAAIPSGMCVCHTCDNPSCVNPEHLFVGSQTDNMADAKSKNRLACGARNGMNTQPDRRPCGERNGKHTKPRSTLRGEQHGMAKLSDDQVQAIRSSYKPFIMTAKLLAHRFNVCRRTIQYIVYEHTWKHVGRTAAEASIAADKGI